MTAVVICLPFFALLSPITLPEALAAMRTHAIWRRNSHMTVLCTLRGKSAVLPRSTQVYRREVAEGDVAIKSICFCLLLCYFWSISRCDVSHHSIGHASLIQMSHLWQPKPLNPAKTRRQTQWISDRARMNPRALTALPSNCELELAVVKYKGGAELWQGQVSF